MPTAAAVREAQRRTLIQRGRVTRAEVNGREIRVFLRRHGPFTGAAADLAYELDMTERQVQDALRWIRRSAEEYAENDEPSWTVPYITRSGDLRGVYALVQNGAQEVSEVAREILAAGVDQRSRDLRSSNKRLLVQVEMLDRVTR